MIWDMLTVTAALTGVLMLVAVLGRIWQDRTPRDLEDKPGSVVRVRRTISQA